MEPNRPAFEWDELDPTGLGQIRNGLVVLVGKHAGGQLQPIGTAFLVKCFDKTAIALTAAHNLAAMHSLQTPPTWHHSSALQQFLPAPAPLNLRHPDVHAIGFNGDRLKSCKILWAIAVEATDTALICLDSSDDPGFFRAEFLLSASNPAPGDSVAVIGFSDMRESPERETATNPNLYSFQLRVLVRTGRVVHVQPEGHMLCRAACAETTIPVFPGMSGGPASVFSLEGPQLEVFGVICSDSMYDDPSAKYDRSKAGQSTIAFIDRVVEVAADGQRHVSFRMPKAVVHPTSRA